MNDRGEFVVFLYCTCAGLTVLVAAFFTFTKPTKNAGRGDALLYRVLDLSPFWWVVLAAYVWPLYWGFMSWHLIRTTCYLDVHDAVPPYDARVETAKESDRLYVGEAVRMNDENKAELVLGEAMFRGDSVSVPWPTSGQVIGSPGSGKSVSLSAIAQQWINADRAPEAADQPVGETPSAK